ncbi:MAG: co-chaperone GroES [Gammaproteobacteria bacterium]|nr:co-chaperone GroES [Gammaproteobacteria bacterium]
MGTSVEVVGHRVLLKPHFEEEKTEWGFELGHTDTFKREKAATVVGKVISVGDMAWKAFDGDNPDWKPWAKVGDVVYFAKYGGKFITIDEEDYIIVNDEDVQAVVHEENKDG